MRTAAPTVGVVVSCDGVVCAAKRRQQRLRRFKGPWIAANAPDRKKGGEGEGKGEDEEWDQNALTPGTAFMAQLGRVLTDGAARLSEQLGISVIVSTPAEPGEGEHKLMARMRFESKMTRIKRITIYGLDADLILLSMLLGVETGAHVRLLREAQEFERGHKDEWRTLDIRGLTQTMFGLESRHKPIRDFVAAMSLLGNDFIPRSLTHSVRNDGIQELLGVLEKHVWGRGMRLVGRDGQLSHLAVSALVSVWAQTEEQEMLAAVCATVRESRREPRPAPGHEPDPALDAWNALPASWASLAILSGGPNPVKLREDWATFYRRMWRPGAPEDYCAGIAWVWDYYSGRPVDQGWSFDSHLPPLWTDIASWIRTGTVAPPPIVYSTPLHDQVHLLAVLPAASVKRLLPPAPAPFHGWMDALSAFWPTSWSLFDVGRTQMWECEAVIPLLPEAVLREWDRQK